jgi:hypothetical protein
MLTAMRTMLAGRVEGLQRDAGVIRRRSQDSQQALQVERRAEELEVCLLFSV